MSHGICKLCLRKTELQNNHLIPAAVSKALRGTYRSIPGPVATTPHVTIAGVRDIRAPLLCRACEERFNRNGENWVLKRMSKGGGFPLLERLELAMPIRQDADGTVFSGPAIGVSTNKLAYLAVSMLWRSVAYDWRSADGTSTVTDIGPFQEECRRYLMGQIAFPADLYVVVVVCSDGLSQGSAHQLAELELPFKAYSFLMCGIFFAIFLGKDVPQYERDKCCFTSPTQPIFLEDRSAQGMRILQRLYKTSRLTRSIRKSMGQA